MGCTAPGDGSSLAASRKSFSGIGSSVTEAEAVDVTGGRRHESLGGLVMAWKAQTGPGRVSPLQCCEAAWRRCAGPLACSRRTPAALLGYDKLLGLAGPDISSRRWGQHWSARVSDALSPHLLSRNET